MPEFIDNQPVIFDFEDVSCSCDTLERAQLINQGDITQFQIGLEPCALSENLVINGGFENGLNDWTQIGAGWAAVNNEACHSGNQAGNIFQSILTQNKYYQVELTITQNTNIEGDFFVSIGQNTINITGIGTFVVSGFANNSDFALVAQSGVDVCVDNVSVFQVNLNYIFGVCDKDGNVLTTIRLLDSLTPGGINPPSINDEKFNLINGFLTVNIDWTDLGIQNGCRSIFILDPCVNQNGQNGVFNGDFSINDGWIATDVAGGSWVILSGSGTYAGTGAASESTFTNDETQVGIGIQYQVTYTLSNMVNTDVTIQLGTASGTTRNSNGTFVDVITANGSDFNIFADSTAAGTATIDDIELELVNDSDIVKDNVSNDFELGTDHECTLQINGCNDTNQFGFQFEDSTFSPTIRVCSKLARSLYPAERSLERYSNGRFVNTFYQRTKTKQLIIDSQPEYVHDFLSLLFGFDHFYIDGTEYIVPEDEEYIPDYSEQDNVGSVEFAVTIKEELIRNVKCVEEGSGCQLPPNFLLNEDDTNDTDFIRLEDGGKIIIVS